MKYIIIRAVCIIACVVQQSVAQTISTHTPQVNVKVLIDSLDKALQRYYIFPGPSALMSKHLKGQLKKGAYRQVTDPSELAAQIAKDIASVHADGHLRIHFDPNLEKALAGPRPPMRGMDSVELKTLRADNFTFKKLEILPGNIGYIPFNGFVGAVEEAEPTITAAFRFLANTRAIIIDLRKNGGGSPMMVRQIASYFVKERTRLNDIYDRLADRTTEFWADPAMAGNMALSMPLYILTSKSTFSAAEDFTYAMQVNKRAVIVGDTTGGGAHPQRPFPIGQGFVASIPFARSINHITKTDWEGTGIIPDVPVDAEEALVKAQTVILTGLMAGVRTPIEKSEIAWALRTLQIAERSHTPATAAALASYSGAYLGFKVFIKDSELHCEDTRRRRTYHLKPITATVFYADDNVQVEFIPDHDGKITALKILSRTGREETVKRMNGN